MADINLLASREGLHTVAIPAEVERRGCEASAEVSLTVDSVAVASAVSEAISTKSWR